MASFTDNVQQLSTFNPYIQQQPLEMMGKVGMYKQGQYDQGVEKIQKSFDTIAGLQVTEKHKAYLQSKLNEMGNQMKVISAADFSNSALVNNTSSQVSTIANDKIVQTGVSSALRRNKQIELMQKAQEKGELTPENQANFQKSDNIWFQEDDLSKGYNATYSPFFDVNKHVIDYIKEVKPKNFSVDEIFIPDGKGGYVRGANGFPALSTYMTTLKKEGKMPSDISAAIDVALSDPRAKKQMHISGEYNYRGYDAQKLAEVAVKTANQQKTSIEGSIDDLYIKLSVNPNDIKIQEEIEQRKRQLDSVNMNLQNNGKIIISDPDTFRANLYESKKRADWVDMFDTVTETSEIKNSPAYQAEWEKTKHTNEMAAKKQEFDWKVKNDIAIRTQNAYQFKINTNLKIQDQEIARIKAGLNPDGTPKTSSGSDLTPTTGKIEGSEAILIRDHDLATAGSSVNSAKNQIIWSKLFPGEDNSNKLIAERNTVDPTTGEPNTPEKALTNLLTAVAKGKGLSGLAEYQTDAMFRINKTLANNKTSLTLEDKKARETLVLAQQKFDAASKVVDEIKKATFLEKARLIKNYKYTTQSYMLDGVSYSVNKEEAVDMGAIRDNYLRKTPQSQAAALSAEYRLRAAHKEKLIEASIPETKDRSNPRILNIKGGFTNFSKDYTEVAGSKNLIDVWAFNHAIGTTISNKVGEYEGILTRDRLKINPNMKMALATGDKKIDDKTSASLKELAGFYKSKKLGTGNNPEEVLSDLLDMTNDNFADKGLRIESSTNSKGEKISTITNADNNSLIITNDEAKKRGFDVNTMYAPDNVKIESANIEARGGKSTFGAITNPASYVNHSSMLTSYNLPALKGSEYFVSVAFSKNASEEYFPYVYVNKGGEEYVLPVKMYSTNLDVLMNQELPIYLIPENIEAAIAAQKLKKKN